MYDLDDEDDWEDELNDEDEFNQTNFYDLLKALYVPNLIITK